MAWICELAYNDLFIKEFKFDLVPKWICLHNRQKMFLIYAELKSHFGYSRSKCLSDEAFRFYYDIYDNFCECQQNLHLFFVFLDFLSVQIL